jgi:glutathione synthase
MSGNQRLLGVVMDPIQTITPAKDTTLAMMLAAQRRGWKLIYLRQNDLSVRDGTAFGNGALLTVMDDLTNWFEMGDSWSGALDALDAILMRKDPPFDMEFIYTTYILELAENRGALVVNKPASLRDINEKAWTAWFPDCAPRSLISREADDIKAFLERERKMALKPLDGMGGRSVFIVEAGDLNTNVILETLTENGTRFALAQQFIPEITDGDKRVLLVDGIAVDYALARIPAPGESRGNLVAGARGEGRKLTARDREIAERVGPVLRDKGVLFAGLDVIGNFLTEINVTSPTGVRELDRAFGLTISDALFDAIESRL